MYKGSDNDDSMANDSKDEQSVKYSIMGTRLANQRTYMAITNTGIAIAGVALSLKKYTVFVFGLILMILATVQYYITEYNLDTRKDLHVGVTYYLPVFLTLGMLMLFLGHGLKFK